MDELLSEKEQIEQMKAWWAENGRFVITGLALGIAVLGGWRYWNTYKLERAEAASSRFDRLAVAVENRDRDNAQAVAAELQRDYGATPYADDAALALARLYVDVGDVEAAADTLRGLVDRSGDSAVGHVARLRLARVLVHLGRADEALPLVDASAPGAFAARYAEIRGDVHVARGDLAAARVAYQAALDSGEPGLIDRNVVQMKLAQTAPAGGGS